MAFSDVNQLTISGRLGREPEYKAAANVLFAGITTPAVRPTSCYPPGVLGGKALPPTKSERYARLSAPSKAAFPLRCVS